MDKVIHIENDNFLKLRKTVSCNQFEDSKNNVLFELTTFESSKFVIRPDADNISTLSVYSQKDLGSPRKSDITHIYEVTNDKHVNHHVVIHQAFFKLSGDGYLRKLAFQAWQMEEVITKNDDIFPKGKDWIAYFLIESGNGIYPISVRPYRHNADLFEIGLESLSDLSHYACVRPTFFVGK
jgi:hypothetical protein